jgi:hypothetical protein
MFVVGAAMMKATFPKEEDLRKQGPKEALESMIKSARKIANRSATEVHIQFIDQGANIKTSDFFDENERDSDRQKSILNFLQKTTHAHPATWSEFPSSALTTTPLLIVTDAGGKATFDGNQVCYAIIRNPGEGPIMGSVPKPFSLGYIENHGTPSVSWQKNQEANYEYFTVYPSGLCDSVSFKAENCPEYNCNFVVNAISGTVESLK